MTVWTGLERGQAEIVSPTRQGSVAVGTLSTLAIELVTFLAGWWGLHWMGWL